MLLYSRDTVVTWASVVCPSSAVCRSPGVRPLSAHPYVKPIFSESGMWMSKKVCRIVPIHHISRLLFVVLFQNFEVLIFIRFFFLIFVYMGAYGRKKFKRPLLWKYTTDSFLKIMHTHSECLPKLFKELWHSKFWIFDNLIFFSTLF